MADASPPTGPAPRGALRVEMGCARPLATQQQQRQRAGLAAARARRRQRRRSACRTHAGSTVRCAHGASGTQPRRSERAWMDEKTRTDAAAFRRPAFSHSSCPGEQIRERAGARATGADTGATRHCTLLVCERATVDQADGRGRGKCTAERDIRVERGQGGTVASSCFFDGAFAVLKGVAVSLLLVRCPWYVFPAVPRSTGPSTGSRMHVVGLPMDAASHPVLHGRRLLQQPPLPPSGLYLSWSFVSTTWCGAAEARAAGARGSM
ncbi:hypothetical protein POSPLADRAFT_1053365 [Postia placenta MAD-698-R-SB12]|uniref:Uncharacterized protein n=1 Tax=Postia placenta MAD-698-R-SB12 TaxID=670580 RepID=A0A1X6NDN8_9APHY|nr:hypothetical protein POSPLADRAFT_1053365 [Postia placenta MAD-698-R-SB12]OSX66749.1 hypothetical protein POSPLADRAFT_1053365 [Postia placenta MAD-698-R-SB12]